MKARFEQLRDLLSRPAAFPFLLLALALAAYGLLIPWLGVYWDDWALSWISQHLGQDAVTRYFSTNRPLLAPLYHLTTSLLGAEPWHWQVFGLFWRWASALMLWVALRRVWRAHPQAANWASLLFLLYPGFRQQHVAIIYGHFFLVLTGLFASFALSLAALEQPRRRWWMIALSLALSLYNLLALEYFFMLELARPLLLWVALMPVVPGRRARLKRVLAAWWPFLLAFIAAGVWRAFFFTAQTTNYDFHLADALRENPPAAIATLLASMARDLWTATGAAWLTTLKPDLALLGSRFTLLYVGVGVFAAALAAGFLLARMPQPERRPLPWRFQALGLGALVMLVSGWSLWLTGLFPAAYFPGDRFTLPFMLGASLLVAGLAACLPGRAWLRVGAVALLVGLAAASHFENSNRFRRDWIAQERFLWQLAWRAPALQPGTTLVTNVLPVFFDSDNSLTAPLNWFYNPQNRSDQMDYALLWLDIRLGGDLLPLLQPGRPIQWDYLAATFNGSTDRLLLVGFQPPGCLRVLDPQIDPNYEPNSSQLQAAARLSNMDLILPEGSARPLPPMFAEEPGHDWCYYYEKADLAAQFGHWDEVTALAETAYALDDHANDLMEHLPFIKAYAHTGRWQQALELTRRAHSGTPAMAEVLCATWQQLDADILPSAEKIAALETVRAELACKP